MLIQITKGILEAQRLFCNFISYHLSLGVRELGDILNLGLFDFDLLHFQLL